MNHKKNWLFCNFVSKSILDVPKFQISPTSPGFSKMYDQWLPPHTLNIKCRPLACHSRYANHKINIRMSVCRRFSGRPHMNMSMFAPDTYTTLFELQSLNCDNYLTALGSTLCTLTAYKQKVTWCPHNYFFRDSSFQYAKSAEKCCSWYNSVKQHRSVLLVWACGYPKRHHKIYWELRSSGLLRVISQRAVLICFAVRKPETRHKINRHFMGTSVSLSRPADWRIC